MSNQNIINEQMRKLAYTQFIDSLIQTAKQLASHFAPYKPMLLQTTAIIGVKSVNVSIKRVNSSIIVGLEFEFDKEEDAKKVMEDIKKRLGS